MIGMKWQHFAVLHLSVSCAGGEWRWSFCAMGPNCFQLPAAAKISGRPLRHAGGHGSKLSRAVKQVLRSWVGWGDQHSLVKRAVLESLFSYSLLQLFEIFAYVQTYGLCILPFQEKTVYPSTLIIRDNHCMYRQATQYTGLAKQIGNISKSL